MQSLSHDELATWDPASRLVALVERIRPRYAGSGLASLNEPERTLLALFDLDNEVCNGGFGQWLFNTPRDLIAIAPECLERIGDEGMLRSVRSILDELGPDALKLGWEEWQDHLHRLPEAFWHRTSTEDRACGSLERGMIERLWSYAEAVTREVRLR